MSIEFDTNIPIYIQIMTIIKKRIITGEMVAGDKVPSVRELATELKTNPNTIQRTFQELEREGIVETKRGLGRYVTSEEAIIMNIKKEMANDLLNTFIEGMRGLGFNNNEIVDIVDNTIKEKVEEQQEDVR